MTTSDHAAYDAFPYESNPFAASHPAHIAGVARLFNLEPVELKNARILELGSAAGGNIIPLALYYPGITVVGVDYSKVQIDDGNRVIEQLGLTNASLHHMSIGDITPEFGQFDYIICHGVFSWVPDDIKDAILRVCNENLTEKGIAYVSYNVYPGWKTHEIARDAMLFHTRNLTDPVEKVAHGRGMIDYMHQMSREGSMFRHVMDAEAKLIQSAQPYYIAHEFFETHNAPCYFNEFARHASTHQLTYLGESDISSMFVENLGEEHKQRLINASGGQQIELEQYLDFLNNRPFRQTLLCKNSNAAHMKRQIDRANFTQLDYISNLVEDSHAENTSAGIRLHAVNDANRWIIAQTPTQIETLRTLQLTAPNTLSFNELQQAVQTATDEQFNLDELTAFLERLTVMGYIAPQMHTPALTFTNAISAKPRMHDAARRYIALTGRVTGALHNIIGNNPLMAALIEKIDGQHSIEQLEDIAWQTVQAGKLGFTDNQTQTALTDPDAIRHEIKTHLKFTLEQLAQHGFLLS